MNGLEKMRLQMVAAGGSLKQDKIAASIQYISETFQDDPTYQEDGVQIVDGEKIYPRIWNYKKSDNLSPTVEIQTRIQEEFKRGQLLILDGEYWLCLKSQCYHGMYWTGKLKQCTHLLQYQDAKTHEIESSWAVLERPYSRTLNNGEIVTTSEMEFKAMLPFNDSTKKINLDRRLLTGVEYDAYGNEIGSVYKITGRDGSSQVINGEGFLVLNMIQDQFNKDKDNLKLMIADYIDPSTPPAPEPPAGDLLKCEIIGRSDIRIGGSPRNYTAKFYDADGTTEIKDSISPIWELIAPEGHEAYYKISLSNGDFVASASAEANDELVGDVIILRLSDHEGRHAKVEMSVTVVMM